MYVHSMNPSLLYVAQREWYWTFSDFWKRALWVCRRSNIFYESNSKNSANLPARARQSFHFQKITVTLKISILPSKNSRWKENSKLIFLILYFVGPQNGQIWFGPGQWENYLFRFSSFLAFKITKEQILFQTQPFKMWKIICFGHFRQG